MTPIEPIAATDIQQARDRIAGRVLRSPLVRLRSDDIEASGHIEIHIKLENLQSIGSFKLRGAANAMLQLSPQELSAGVSTGSAGNMAQGVGWIAREMGIPFQVAVPDSAPHNKLDAIRGLGGEIVSMPFEEWWNTLRDHGHPKLRGHFLHPVSDPRVIAGNGTIGLEIVEDLPDVDAVVVPFGGGGLSSGIACAMRSIRPQTKVYAAEVEGASPFARAWKNGAPIPGEHRRSFIDGIGSANVLPEMWPLARSVLSGSWVASSEQVADAVRLLAVRHRVVAEGAGAASVAAAITSAASIHEACTREPHGRCKVVCVISGGNIDASVFAKILEGTSVASSSAPDRPQRTK